MTNERDCNLNKSDNPTDETIQNESSVSLPNVEETRAIEVLLMENCSINSSVDETGLNDPNPRSDGDVLVDSGSEEVSGKADQDTHGESSKTFDSSSSAKIQSVNLDKKELKIGLSTVIETLSNSTAPQNQVESKNGSEVDKDEKQAKLEIGNAEMNFEGLDANKPATRPKTTSEISSESQGSDHSEGKPEQSNFEISTLKASKEPFCLNEPQGENVRSNDREVSASKKTTTLKTTNELQYSNKPKLDPEEQHDTGVDTSGEPTCSNELRDGKVEAKDCGVNTSKPLQGILRKHSETLVTKKEFGELLSNTVATIILGNGEEIASDALAAAIYDELVGEEGMMRVRFTYEYAHQLVKKIAEKSVTFAPDEDEDEQHHSKLNKLAEKMRKFIRYLRL